MVEVTGGPAKEREIVEKTVHWCIKKLLPRVRTLDIEVKLTKCDAYGYCLMTDNHKTFELEIRKGMNLYDLISTVCHEMVHVKQYFRKEMDDESMRWKSRQLPLEVEYMDRPWEKEAFRMEEKLAIECFKNIAINFAKK
jgi:hypothetical protein